MVTVLGPPSDSFPPLFRQVGPNERYFIHLFFLLLMIVQHTVCRLVWSKKTLFQTKISATHHASAWGLVWRNPKGFLISTKFKGSLGHLKFDQFYIVYFYSPLSFLDRDLYFWKKHVFVEHPSADIWFGSDVPHLQLLITQYRSNLLSSGPWKL